MPPSAIPMTDEENREPTTPISATFLPQHPTHDSSRTSARPRRRRPRDRHPRQAGHSPSVDQRDGHSNVAVTRTVWGGHECPGLVGWLGARPGGVTRLTAVAGRPGIAVPVRSGQGGGGVIPHDQAPRRVLIPLGRKTGLRRVCRPSGTGSGGAGAAGLPCGLSVSRRVGLVHPPADRVLPVAAAGARPVRHRGPDYSLAVRGTQPCGAGAGPVGREGVTRYGW